MRPRRQEQLRTALRLLLGALLLWAAVSKLSNPTAFLAAVYAYELPFPRDFLKLVAAVLPWAELLCALLLLGDLWTPGALLCGLAMMACFLVATGQAWLRGLSISCGCFDLKLFGLGGEDSRLAAFLESPVTAFFRNVLLTGAILYLLRPVESRSVVGELAVGDGGKAHAKPTSRPRKRKTKTRRKA